MIGRMEVLSTGETRSEESEDLDGWYRNAIPNVIPGHFFSNSDVGSIGSRAHRNLSSYIIGGFSKVIEKAESCDDFASTIHGG